MAVAAIGATDADRGIAALKIAQLIKIGYLSDEFRDRCSDRDAQAQSINPEGMFAPFKGQHAAPKTRATDKSGLGEDDTHGAGLCLRGHGEKRR